MTFDRTYRVHGLQVLCAAAAMTLIFLPRTVRAQSENTPADSPQAPASEERLPPGVIHEPTVIGKGIDFFSRKFGEQGDTANDGLYPELGNMITGAGWITAGPGYRHHLWGAHTMVDGSTALSWRGYKMAQGRFELTDLAHNHMAAGTQIRWQDLTQITYFGVGSQAPESERSQYRLKSTDIVGRDVASEALARRERRGGMAAPASAGTAGRIVQA